ncbi:calpain-like protease [Rhypophila decipiens]|uniref:Calpain-like protease n=1 Tax=Rhypophila decipiens TaxID=261697 RepID=A0AAN6Y1L9_9PEZI|nr:calpain-like protease [Rhypophila decipiens]
MTDTNKEHERLLARSTGSDALKHAIAAADLYMQAALKANVATERSRLRRKCSDLLALGERLKANSTVASAASRPPVPESTRPLTIQEKTIIIKSSRLHGSVFPPWETAPAPDTFTQAGPEGDVFVDPATFSLSAEQESIFSGWRRPEQTENIMTATSEIDLAQDLATDCSVVASLCAAIRHFGPSKASLLPFLMYPYDHQALRPGVSKNGKYVFRMNFNGCWRKVVIDDRLPMSSTDRTLYVVDRRNPHLVWPALVEKAYLKIRGGYDFPGSNSGTDLHVLTGWIPEQIFLQSDDIELDETWNRIKTGFDADNAIVTLGTGKILPEEEQTLGLVKEHDYAVLNLVKDSRNRLFRVKNPWCDSRVWTGAGSSATLSLAGDTDDSPPEDNLTNTFWMTFEDVLQHFDSLYVNWNPALFAYRQDHHFTWEMPDKTEDLVFTHNPQYSVMAPPSSSPIWVLLSRHWQDGELEILRQRKADRDDNSLATVSRQLGFMSLALFATNPPGTRVPLSEGHRCLHQGPYVDSPNTLLKYQPAQPGVAQTLVVAQGELPLPKYNFTLSFFSNQPLTISPASEPLAHSISVHGAWTRRTAGGSAVHASYLSNPQFALSLPRATPLSLVLSTDTPNLPIHVAVLYSNGGQRVTSVSGRDILCASAEYTCGCTYASLGSIDAGTYTVVVSTFEPGQLGKFTLRVSADVPPAVKPVLADAAGRLRTAPRELAVFGEGEERIRARLGITRLSRVCVVARSSGGGGGAAPCSAIRVSIELGSGVSRRRVLVVSGEGEFADASLGLRTGEVDVDPEVVRSVGGGGGELWVVVEQIGGGGRGSISGSASLSSGGSCGGRRLQSQGRGVEVEVLSDAPVYLGGWENDDDL